MKTNTYESHTIYYKDDKCHVSFDGITLIELKNGPSESDQEAVKEIADSIVWAGMDSQSEPILEEEIKKLNKDYIIWKRERIVIDRSLLTEYQRELLKESEVLNPNTKLIIERLINEPGRYCLIDMAKVFPESVVK